MLFELRRREPMLDPRLFARRGFGVGSLSLTLQFFAQFGFLFVVLQYLQFVLGYSPLEAGPRDPADGAHADGHRAAAPKLARRLGVRVVGGVGLALMGVGFLVFTTLETGSSYWRFGIGALDHRHRHRPRTAPATTAIVSSLPADTQGIASAVNDLAREVGGAFGIAVLGSVLNSGYRADVAPATAGLPGPAAERPRTRSPPATRSPSDAGRMGRHWSSRPRQAFVNGLSIALLVGAGVLFAASVIVAVLAPRREDVARAEALEPDAGTESTAPALASGA